tara:strand:+ start:113 stop:850 length:738 start_codon:yes stop_codon:yes gene_type:complete
MSGIIYKIVCNETGDCYVGSTTQSLTKRMSAHKCLTPATKKTASHSIIERNNYSCEIIEAVNFGDDKKIMLYKEKEWIVALNGINKFRPIRTIDEHKADMKKNEEKYKEQEWVKSKIIEYSKNYYQANKEQCVSKNKLYYQTERGKEMKSLADKRYREGKHREENLQKKREYHAKHKDEIAERNKIYNKENAEAIKERKRLAYLANKEGVLERNRLYREANRDKINVMNKAAYEARKAKAKNEEL